MKPEMYALVKESIRPEMSSFCIHSGPGKLQSEDVPGDCEWGHYQVEHRDFRALKAFCMIQ